MKRNTLSVSMLVATLLIANNCLATNKTENTYQKSLNEMIQSLNQLQTENTALKHEVSTYSKEDHSLKKKDAFRAPAPIATPSPRTMLTPMDREAMSSSIFFPGGFPKPIPQKNDQSSQNLAELNQNNDAPPPPQYNPNPGEMPPPPPGAFDNNNMMDDNYGSSSFNNGGYINNGGGGFYPYTNQTSSLSSTLSFTATTKQADNAYSTFTYSTNGNTFTFDSGLTLTQTISITTTDGDTLSSASLALCDSSYSNCSTAIPISNNAVSLTASNLTAASNASQMGSAALGDNIGYAPVFYFVVTATFSSGNSRSYDFTMNYPNNSGQLTCDTTSRACTQSSQTTSTSTGNIVSN